MKKTLFILVTAVLCGTVLHAQQVAIEKSAEFDEPEYGWNKLMQLKNGNTFLFHSTKRDGIDVTVYNKQRKQISSKTLESKLWDVGKMKESKILGLYEINGEPVLFVMQTEDREPTLYRMRINPNTGSIVNEAKMGHLPKASAFAGFAIAYGHVDPTDIIVEKDPQSDCYAVIYFNSFAHDRSERIKVVHYDGTHKMLGQAFYESPNGKFKYLRYIGSVVDGSKRVFVATYGFNNKPQGEDSRVIVSRLNVGDTGFVHKVLDFSEDFEDTKSVMLYNRNNNKIQLMTVAYDETKHSFFGNKTNTYYSSLISYLDPETLTLLGIKPLNGTKVSAYGQQNIDKDYEFHGVPLQMIINKDNSTTILSEEVSMITRTDSHGRVESQKSILGPIGVSELSDTGAELRGYAISKKQEADGILPILYMATRGKGHFQYPRSSFGGHVQNRNVNQFLSFDYINSDKTHYIIFNDLPTNSEKDEDEKKRKTVAYVSNTNTMCYKLSDQKLDKFYLFGEPDDKHNSTFCYIESSDYNKELNTYATMIVERDGRDKVAKIAWVTFN